MNETMEYLVELAEMANAAMDLWEQATYNSDLKRDVVMLKCQFAQTMALVEIAKSLSLMADRQKERER